MDYTDPIRTPLVMTWSDGTVVVDQVSDLAEHEGFLREYLMAHHTSPRDTDVPVAVYAFCRFCGHLHQCAVLRDDHAQYIEDDWIYVKYDVIAKVPAGSPDGLAGHDHGSDQLVCSVSLRIGGRG